MSKELQTTTHTVSEPAGQTGGSANPVDGGTPMQGSSKLTIFISYMHEDTRIADAITNAIGKAFGSEIPVFLDKARIQYGDDIPASIDENLRKADVLVVVGTGQQRASVWAGYELGFFSACHSERDPARAPMWGTIIHFCSESVGPAKNDNLKYFKLGFTEDELKLDQKKFEDALRVQDDDGFVVWLSQLLFATSGRNSSDDQRIIEKYCKVAATFYQAIFSAFKERPKAVLRPQKHLFISYCGQDALAPPHVLPIRSTIHLRGGVQSVFGIPQAGDPLVLSWGEFCDAIGNQVYSRVWTTILSRIAVESCSGQFLDGRNVITSHDGHTLYRLILTACTSYANSRVELSLYVIEVLRKPDIAHNLYALLAKGLSMALRFRSLFLEDDSPFSSVNVLIGEKPLNKIAEEISDEIQHLNQDVNETISLPAAAYTKVMPADDLIAMSKKWRLIKERLVLAYSNAIDAPEMDQEKARQALVDALTELRKEIEPQNRLFIAAIAKKLTDLP